MKDLVAYQDGAVVSRTIVNTNAGTVSILLGDGHGRFQSPIACAVGARPCSVAVGDFNGDTRQDLVVANSGANTVSVLLNTCLP